MNTNESPITTPYVWPEETHTWTWPQVAESALVTLGGTANLKQLNQLIEGHPKTKANKWWRARLRAVLQKSPTFVRIDSGVWALASGYSPEQIATFEQLRRERWPLLGPREKEDSE